MGWKPDQKLDSARLVPVSSYGMHGYPKSERATELLVGQNSNLTTSPTCAVIFSGTNIFETLFTVMVIVAGPLVDVEVPTAAAEISLDVVVDGGRVVPRMLTSFCAETRALRYASIRAMAARTSWIMMWLSLLTGL